MKVKQIVVVDIDGTISKPGKRLEFLKQDPPDWDSFYNACFDDEPILPVIDLVKKISKDYSILFCTGRRKSCEAKTRAWLLLYCGEFTRSLDILFRPNDDHRHDTEVKPKLLKDFHEDLLRSIRDNGYQWADPPEIAFILEDRNSMVKKWRELGYTCLQVADGDF